MASMLNAAGSFSSSSLSTEYNYHVFLSFRGPDTRKTFLGHLYNALVQAGIHAFKDDKELVPGEEISPQLKKAIQESKISIVVFSKDYASSTWCLDELVEILELSNTKRRILLPIFYGVDPSHVRKQEGSFKKAFQAYEAKEEKEKVNKWKNALKHAANICGKEITDAANGDESVLIRKIVKDVLSKVDIKNLNIPEYVVGIDSCVHNIIKSLDASDDASVSFVGIHGMVAQGKTTIAKVVYKELFRKFEGSCFLVDVNDSSKGPETMVELQKQLLRETLGVNILKTKKIGSVDSGISYIKELLGRKKILLVLDDLDKPQQLDIFGGRDALGKGSKIIITTTNRNLLAQLKVQKHSVEKWSDEVALDLFSFHAFGKKTPEEKQFVQLSRQVVKLCGNLPSALVNMGKQFSRLSQSLDEWEREIHELRKLPDDQIHFKLKRSYDSLEDDLMKSIFLDIACFFVGEDVDFMATVLSGRYRDNLSRRIHTLKERSLIAIDSDKNIRMNDLVQKMGREIVRQMSHKYPGKHSRIWDHNDALDLLNNQMGTEAVEGLTLDELDELNMQSFIHERTGDDLDIVHRKQMGAEEVEGLPLDVEASKFLTLRAESFKEMRFLQLLRIDGVNLAGSFQFFPRGLIWLSWKGFTLNSLPLDFQLNNLVALDLQYSHNLEELKVLNKLKILNLSYSKFTRTPNFLGLPNLEELILQGCERLVELHPSICNLGGLVSLYLSECSGLKFLPPGISQLSKLESLLVEDCTNLESISELPSSLETLYADGCDNLKEIQGIENVYNCDIFLFCSKSLSDNFKSLAQALCKRDDYSICINGGNLPEWFNSDPKEGSSLSFHVPASAVSDGKLRLVVWVVCACDIESAECELGVKISTEDGYWLFYESISPKTKDYCSWINHIMLTDMEGGDELKLSVEIIEGDNFVDVKELGIYLIEKKPNVEEEDNREREETTKEKQDVKKDDSRTIASPIHDEEDGSDDQETAEGDDSESASSIVDEEEDGSDRQETDKAESDVESNDRKSRSSVIDEEDGGGDQETAEGKPDVEEGQEGGDNQGTTLDEPWNNYLRKELPKWYILELAVRREGVASRRDDEDWDDTDFEGGLL